MVYNIGLECGADFCGKRCNAYLITGDKNIIIDTVPKEFENEFESSVEKYISVSEIDCVFLLSVLPERAGAIEKLLVKNPDITVYATAAGIRNLTEITGRQFKSVICKNGVEITLGDNVFVPYITPNITSPDSMLLADKKAGSMYTGELFSTVEGTEDYFEKYLRCYITSISSALDVVSRVNPSVIYTAYGRCENCDESIKLYRDLLKKEMKSDFVVVAYSSKTGNNKSMAVFCENELNNSGIKTKLFCLDIPEERNSAVCQINCAIGLVLCLPTENRTMPGSVWGFLSSMDVNLVSGKPYFVSGSYGWSCEGAFMANEILSMLKMRRVCKPVECVFTPNDGDKQNLCEAVKALTDFITKQKEKSINA